MMMMKAVSLDRVLLGNEYVVDRTMPPASQSVSCNAVKESAYKLHHYRKSTKRGTSV